MLLHIAEAARSLGVTPRTIRFYEQKGLLAPDKTPHNGYRLYGPLDLLRLKTILALRETGLSLADLQTVMETYGMEQHEELRYLLELQRYLLYAERLDLDGRIRMNEELIVGLGTAGSLPDPDALFTLADDTRRKRELRRSWQDHYGFDRQAESFDSRVRSGHPDYPEYEAVLNGLIALVRPQAGETGLDLGTGTGNLAGALLAHGVRMKAVDQSPAMLRHCRRKFPLLSTKLGNLLAVPFEDRHFDFAVSSYVLHRLSPEERLLAAAEALRVLKPHGRLALACPMPPAEWEPLLRELRSRGFLCETHELPGGVTALLAAPLRASS